VLSWEGKKSSSMVIMGGNVGRKEGNWRLYQRKKREKKRAFNKNWSFPVVEEELQLAKREDEF